jgi:hypothetical protein
LCGVERLSGAKVKAMASSETELQWARTAVERMLVRIALRLAGELDATSLRLRRWAR